MLNVIIQNHAKSAWQLMKSYKSFRQFQLGNLDSLHTLSDFYKMSSNAVNDPVVIFFHVFVFVDEMDYVCHKQTVVFERDAKRAFFRIWIQDDVMGTLNQVVREGREVIKLRVSNFTHCKADEEHRFYWIFITDDFSDR